MNENIYSSAFDISKRIQLATNTRVYGEQYASENYQIMNYGIGGKITPHVDSAGVKYNSDYNDRKSE